MKIVITGAGQMGTALIRQYSNIGHDVKMTNASNVVKLNKLQVETGAKAVSLIEVVNSVEVLVVSIPDASVDTLDY